MTVSVAWEDQANTVIRITFHHHWSWDDALAAWSEAGRMLEQVDHLVSLMMCWDNENWLPGDSQQKLLALVRDIHPRLERVVIVRRNAIFQQFFRLFDLLYEVPFDLAYVSTVEAARQMLLPASYPV